jgi:hypothetical protein
MNTQELAVAISESLENTVQIDTVPKIRKGTAVLECDDDEGNSFVIRVTQTNVSEDDDDDEEPAAAMSLDDVDN